MIKFFNNAYIDAPVSWQIGFQDTATPTITGIVHFHNHLIFFLLVIGSLVFWLIYRSNLLFNAKKLNPAIKAFKFTHSTILEVVWTITPGLLLLLIAGPSFALLYAINEGAYPNVILKIVGHQWYWSYHFDPVLDITINEKHVWTPLFDNPLEFDSYIVSEDDLAWGGLRLLEVDNRLKLPFNNHILLKVMAADVLHSWAVPSLGLKLDACPGRINFALMYILRQGVFYGQCSEICGVNHGFIPIVVESLCPPEFTLFAIKNLEA